MPGTGRHETTESAGVDVASSTEPSEVPGRPEVPDEVEAPTDPATDAWTRYGPEPEIAPGRFASRAARLVRALSHEWFLAAAGSVALAVIMTWPTALHPRTTVPSDIWDPTLVAWELAWSGHALTTDPSQIWNANAFYPDNYSLAFTDSFLGYSPASLIGHGPAAALLRYNIIYVLVAALAFFGAYVLLRQLGSRPLGAAVAGAAAAYAPWRLAHAGHLHVLSVGGIALSLAMIARGHGYSLTHGLRPERVKPGWALAGWCVAAWQITIGFAIGLPFAYILAGLCVVCALVAMVPAWWRRKVGRWSPGRLWRLLLADGIGILIFAAVGLLMALPYLIVSHRHPEAVRTLIDLGNYSPGWRSLLTAPAYSLPWGDLDAAARASMGVPAETTLLPGFVLLGLAGAGLVFSIWSVRTRLALAAALAASLVLALGTHFLGGRFTYVPLYQHLPGWNALRTPGRLVVWITFLLGVLAAGAVSALAQRADEVAADRVTGRPGLAVRLALLIPLALVLIEGTNTLPHPVVPAQPAAMRTAVGPLLVLPSDQLNDENIMLWSTTKFQKMVNGGSGFLPVDQGRTREAAQAFPDPTSVDYLRGLGIRTVIVLKDRIGGTPYADVLTRPIEGLGISRTDQGDAVVFTLSPP